MNSEGIGLGLTIVQQIVQSAEGSVTVNSKGVGKGSTFTFKIKMLQKHLPSEEEIDGIAPEANI